MPSDPGTSLHFVLNVRHSSMSDPWDLPRTVAALSTLCPSLYLGVGEEPGVEFFEHCALAQNLHRDSEETAQYHERSDATSKPEGGVFGG